jgi:DNA-binding GntR family transcriptional regulator
MPKKYGVKEKDLVVSYVVNLVLTGKLRSGDRVDRNEIAQELGLSRVPIQEAVVQLEHDGVLSTQYHRGAYVERFDESVVREHYALYGLLSGIASARAAVDGPPRILDQLTVLINAMHSSKESRAFQETAWRFRRVINDESASPRLQAAIRASQTFIPRGLLAGLPQQPCRDAAFLRGRDRRDPPARPRRGPRGVRRSVRGDGQDHAR